MSVDLPADLELRGYSSKEEGTASHTRSNWLSGLSLVVVNSSAISGCLELPTLVSDSVEEKE